MAEAAMFTVASNLLSTIASSTFEKAFERTCSIWEAREELDKLKKSIQTIHAVLLDAEKKQQSSAAINDWIKRVRDVFYEADDLFDEVATDDKIKQHIIKGSDKLLFLKKVRVFCSRLNPIVSRNSIAMKVKSIRKSLLDISTDMLGFGFVRCNNEDEMTTGKRIRQDIGSFVDSKNVIGRNEDKKTILEMLLNDSNMVELDVPGAIAIVGIGGMGKTTLAQLIYNDDEVKMNFDTRWFACISDTCNEKEVLGKIVQAIGEESFTSFTISQLQTKIRVSTKGKKFLLVLDDVWDDNRGRWLNRMSLFGEGAKGSRIIVTTRSSPVATAVGAFTTHELGGLSEDDSWDLFKSIAFSPINENNPRLMDLGREIVKKCRNVPLAIKSLGSLLFEKNTIQEWESIRNTELPKLGHGHEDGIMPVLKLSYDHLPSNLKQCFAYCSLFPKDYEIVKQDLVYLWIAQGYIWENKEDEGHSCFMYLMRRGFFQDVEKDDLGEIRSCKMHDLIHDMAQHVTGEEMLILITSSNQSKCTRHVSVGNSIDDSWSLPVPLLSSNRLRSFVFMNDGSVSRQALDQLFASFKLLRTLSLRGLEIENVSSSIGELKHLRYLDLSWNNFESLPDSLTNILNLLFLDTSWCRNLKALPDDFRQLIHLQCLNIRECSRLKHLPPGIGELTCLEYLSDFKVGKPIEGVKMSEINALSAVEPLRGELRIEFDTYMDDWDEDECWKLPVSMQQLHILFYPGMRIPYWANDHFGLLNLASLHLVWCLKVKYLPPLRSLPNLRSLSLINLSEIEYIEEAEANEGDDPFFSCLEKLELFYLPKMKGWWRKGTTTVARLDLTFLSLSQLVIKDCPEFKSIPLCPHLRELDLKRVDPEVVQQLLSLSLEQIKVSNCNWVTSLRVDSEPCGSLDILQLTSPNLKAISMWDCHGLMSIQIESLQYFRVLEIDGCNHLKNLHIAHLSVLEKCQISECTELELWEEDKIGVDWNSLPNLSLLLLDTIPALEKLPDCLRDRYALGKLQIVQL